MTNLILLCFATAGLTVFLDTCFQKGMIFRRYYNWITYWFSLDTKTSKPQWYVESITETACVVDGVTYTGGGLAEYVMRPVFKKNKYQWLWKILGGCTYCFGTWIFICTYLISPIQSESLQPCRFCYFAFMGILGIGINHVFIKLIEKI